MVAMPGWPWAILVTDARPWVATDTDPAARWALLTGVLDRPDDDAEVLAARREMLTHPATRDLLDRLDPWDSGRPLSGHDHPHYAPNLLTLLADRGLRTGDDPRVDRVLDQMLDHQEPDGRFSACGPARGGAVPAWDSLLCDNHAVVDVLLRYGRGDDPRLRAGLVVMATDLSETPTRAEPGRACLPRPPASAARDARLTCARR